MLLDLDRVRGAAGTFMARRFRFLTDRLGFLTGLIGAGGGFAIVLEKSSR